MSPDRQLAAIMFIDIVGYTGLMQNDESAAIKTIRKFKDTLEAGTERHSGRIVQYFGDGAVITFGSSTNCALCAIEIQEEFRDILDIPTRIGLHLGEVLFQSSNVFGDGVNIASRIETMCIPGSIFLSRSIRDQIKNKSEFELKHLGKYHFKNVDESMDVYAVINEGFPIPDPEQIQGKFKSNTSISGKRRKLLAIMSTDLVGLEFILDKDDQRAFQLIEMSRNLQSALVADYGGSWLANVGHSCLFSFPTATDAVSCAKEIQKQLLNDLELKLKIGLHLGETIIEDDDIFGDGVMVAERLQKIAEPGGIYLSGSIHRAIRGNQEILTVYLGQLTQENSFPSRVYALRGKNLPLVENISNKNLTGSFWAAIKRRNIHRVALVYAAVAFTIITLFPKVPFLPEYGSSMISGLLFLGLIISLVLAWYYERSPDGFILINSRKSWENPFTNKQKKPLTGNFIILALIVTSIAFNIYQAFKNMPDPLPLLGEKSIAVLPFSNLSNDPQQAYFVDGIQEDIMIQLAKISGLHVKSRTSTLQYRDLKSKSIQDIGQELGVAHVLEGSVRKAGSQLRITAQLIEVETDNHIWSEAYNRNLTDVFAIQSEVASSIAKVLKVKLTVPEIDEFSKIPTIQISAYDLVLRAREIWRSIVGEDDLDRVIMLMRQAIAIDNKYAPAYALLGDAFRYKGNHLGSKQIFADSALKYINQALALDPNHYRALTARSIILKHPWVGNRADGLKDQEKAIKLVPIDAEELWSLGIALLRSKNRYEQGAVYIIRSIKLEWGLKDPSFYVKLAHIYEYIGDYQKAESYCKEALKLEPDFIGALHKLYWVSMLDKKYAAALPYAIRVKREFPSDWRYIDRVAWVYLKLQQWEEAENQLKELSVMEKERYQTMDSINAYIPWRHRMAFVIDKLGRHEEATILAQQDLQILESILSMYPTKRDRIERYSLATTHAFLKNPEAAIEYLENAFQVNTDLGYDHYVKDPHFDPYRDLPRFKKHESKVRERDYGKKRQKINQILKDAILEFEASARFNSNVFEL